MVSSAPPHEAMTSISASLECVRNFLDETKIARSEIGEAEYLLLIDEIPDGTIRKRSFESGVLSSSGDLWLKHALKTALGERVQVEVARSLPVRNYFESGSVMSIAQLKKLSRAYGAKTILTVNGAYTAYNTGMAGLGDGLGVTYEDSDFSGDTAIGRSSQRGSIGLNLALGDPVLNRVLKTVALEADIHDHSASINVDLGFESVGGAYNGQIFRVDTPHRAQVMLMEAAALVMIQMMFDIPYSECHNGKKTAPSQIVIKMKAFDRTTPAGQWKMIRGLLRDADYLPAGVYGFKATETAIRNFELEHRLLPLTKSDKARTYLRLLTKASLKKTQLGEPAFENSEKGVPPISDKEDAKGSEKDCVYVTPEGVCVTADDVSTPAAPTATDDQTAMLSKEKNQEKKVRAVAK